MLARLLEEACHKVLRVCSAHFAGPRLAQLCLGRRGCTLGTTCVLPPRSRPSHPPHRRSKRRTDTAETPHGAMRDTGLLPISTLVCRNLPSPRHERGACAWLMPRGTFSTHTHTPYCESLCCQLVHLLLRKPAGRRPLHVEPPRETDHVGHVVVLLRIHEARCKSGKEARKRRKQGN